MPNKFIKKHDMEQLLKKAQFGNHEGCDGCPWNPTIVGPIAFGVSCQKHGIDWSSPGNVISMQVVQDPAGTTPEKTGCLCFVCNSRNPSDKTAQHAYDLWKATVCFESPSGVDPFLKYHYWTNALLHGAHKKSQAKLRTSYVMNLARQHCTDLLDEQIKNLAPRVIIANGEVAANSLYDVGLITVPWVDFKNEFVKGAYSESAILPSGVTTTIFCTYHTSATAVNTHVARLYTKKIKNSLDERLEKLRHYPPVKTFLEKNRPNIVEGKGMMVLLLHWLDIGIAIRNAHMIKKTE